MKKSRYSEHQIIQILKEAQAGKKTPDLCREYGISSTTFYNWKAKYGGMESSDVKRLRELEEENRRLKKMFAELSLDHQILKEVIEKKAVSAEKRRELVRDIQEQYILSERRTCRIIPISRTVLRYQPKLRCDDVIINALKTISEAHPRWGFGKLYHYLRNQGHRWNHKRVYRVYCAMKLNLRVTRRKRLPKRFPSELAERTVPNQTWSMDFMSDALLTGQRFRTLNIIDDFNREALAIEVDTSLPAQRVVRVLGQIADWHGYPTRVRIDNGPEFISTTLMRWSQDHNVILDFIQPYQPAQNAYIERFNRTYREEVLDFYLFHSLLEVRDITQRWMNSYNQERPHDALNGMTPAAFRFAAS